MLAQFPASTVLVAKDLARAKKFYTEKFGFELIDGPEGLLMFKTADGGRIVIYQKEGGSKATHTVLGFQVTNLEELLKELKAKGVQQDMNDLPEGANAEGIVSYGPVKSAWINDSEGNIIGLNQM